MRLQRVCSCFHFTAGMLRHPLAWEAQIQMKFTLAASETVKASRTPGPHFHPLGPVFVLVNQL